MQHRDIKTSDSDDPDDGDDTPQRSYDGDHTVIAQIVKTAGMLTHALTTSPVYDPYTRTSLFFNILGIILYLVDYVSDIVVAYLLKDEIGPSALYFQTWTIVLIIVPLVIVNIFSVVWYHQDHIEHPGGFCPRKEKRSGRERVFLILSHLVCLGPLVRQAHIAWCGRQEQKEHAKKKTHMHVEGPFCINTASKVG